MKKMVFVFVLCFVSSMVMFAEDAVTQPAKDQSIAPVAQTGSSVITVKECQDLLNAAKGQKEEVKTFKQKVEEVIQQVKEGKKTPAQASIQISKLVASSAVKSNVKMRKAAHKVAKKVLYQEDLTEAMKAFETAVNTDLAKVNEEIANLDDKISGLDERQTVTEGKVEDLEEGQVTQDANFADLAKKVEDYRLKFLKFEVILYGSFSSVEQGVIKAGAGILIPVSKKRLFDIEVAALVGIAASKEMGMVEFLVATPFVLKEWKDKEISLLLAPELNFQMVIDVLGNSGGDNFAPQEGKMFSYGANAGAGVKAFFGEYWFVGAKLLAGYAYTIDPRSYEDKNKFNLGFSVGGGAQF